MGTNTYISQRSSESCCVGYYSIFIKALPLTNSKRFSPKITVLTTPQRSILKMIDALCRSIKIVLLRLENRGSKFTDYSQKFIFIELLATIPLSEKIFDLSNYILVH